MTNPATAETFILIRGRGRVSALGGQVGPESLASPFSTHAAGLPVAALPAAAEAAVAELQRAHPTYRQLDRTVLLALLAARQAMSSAQSAVSNNDLLIENQFINNHSASRQKHSSAYQLINHQHINLAVSIGSSRGGDAPLGTLPR